MWPDWVSNPGPLTYESGALLTALRGPASELELKQHCIFDIYMISTDILDWKC